MRDNRAETRAKHARASQLPTCPAQDQVTPPPAVSPSSTQSLAARVTQILDGDTLDGELQAWRERIRDISIDTPETKHSKA